MPGTLKGMSIIHNSVAHATTFIRHGKQNITPPVRAIYKEYMEIEKAMHKQVRNKDNFEQWCHAYDKVFGVVVQMGYGASEVRTGQ